MPILTKPIRGSFVLVAICAMLMSGCAGKKQPLETFTDRQKERTASAAAYIDADFDFWAALYEPTSEDLEAIRLAWVEHGQAFPESKAFAEVEKESRKTGQRIILVSLFMTEFDKADLREKSLGWTLHPTPLKIVELSENDVVLRTLMPVRNQWARYFLVKYAPEIWGQSSQLVVSNRTSRVELKRWKFNPSPY